MQDYRCNELLSHSRPGTVGDDVGQGAQTGPAEAERPTMEENIKQLMEGADAAARERSVC